VQNARIAGCGSSTLAVRASQHTREKMGQSAVESDVEVFALTKIHLFDGGLGRM
jgi:hypothetical protein